MSPVAAKVLMCLCAGTTGAAVLPVAQHVQSVVKARKAVHRSTAHRPTQTAAVRAAPSVALPVPCTPIASAPLVAMGLSAAVSADFTPPATDSKAPAGDFAKPGSDIAGGYDNRSGFAPIGFAAPGGFIGPIPPRRGATPADEDVGAASVPATSPAPDAATWATMITGIGITGGIMRYRRHRARTA